MGKKVDDIGPRSGAIGAVLDDYGHSRRRHRSFATIVKVCIAFFLLLSSLVLLVAAAIAMMQEQDELVRAATEAKQQPLTLPGVRNAELTTPARARAEANWANHEPWTVDEATKYREVPLPDTKVLKSYRMYEVRRPNGDVCRLVVSFGPSRSVAIDCNKM